MSWKILVTSSAIATTGQQALDKLRAAGCELVFPAKPGPFKGSDLRDLLAGADAVIASLDHYSADVLASPEVKPLKIISRWGVGYDAVDLGAATRNGIIVTNTPGILDEAVADYAFALMLAVGRQVHEGHLKMHEGVWKTKWGADIFRRTLGIVGCGRIGMAVARRAAGFEMRVLASGRKENPHPPKPGVQFVPLDELLGQSDFVSIHAALNEQSRGLIGEAQLRKMKPTAYLINTARGAHIDEMALDRALREGWIAGAALDVFCEEPLPANHPLRSAPNLLLSPHQASLARDTGERVSHAAVQAILDLMSGRRPQNVLNPDAFSSAALRG